MKTSPPFTLLKHLAMASLAAATYAAVPSTAHACGWDWETYEAESEALPCVFDAVLGYWPKHTPRYHQTRVDATSFALNWAPQWTDGLDAQGISLMKLGQLEDARAVMERRLAVDDKAYPGHANLGTLLTFTGEYDAALEHIDQAMEIEPQAHFGREKYHRALVVFLDRVRKDPQVAEQENFLGLKLRDDERANGSAEVFAAHELQDDAVDALVSMITVYGGEDMPELYLALGEVLAAHGDQRLAYSAYRRALGLEHPRGPQLKQWMATMHTALEKAYNDKPDTHEGAYKGIHRAYVQNRKWARQFQKDWASWEKKALARGLKNWTSEGIEFVYARMRDKRERCSVPHLIEGVHMSSKDTSTDSTSQDAKTTAATTTEDTP